MGAGSTEKERRSLWSCEQEELPFHSRELRTTEGEIRCQEWRELFLYHQREWKHVQHRAQNYIRVCKDGQEIRATL